MNLVNNIFGTDLNDGVQLAIVFAVLLVVLLLVVWLIRVVFGNNVSRMAKNRQPRLAVTDAAIVDDKRRLVLVRRDNVEHLILIGGNSDVLLESNISRVTPVQVPVTDNVATTSTNNNSQKLEQKKTEQKERLLKNRTKSFSTITGGSDKVGKVAKSGIASAVGLTAIGAGAIASAKNTVANTSTNTADVISSAKGSVSSIVDSRVDTGVDTDANVAKTATQSVVETASNTSKITNVAVKNTVNKLKNVVNAEKEVDELTTSFVVDEPIVDKIKEVNLDQNSAIQKSAAELDLEKVLADDKAISDTSNGEDDMQKILDELTAEIK